MTLEEIRKMQRELANATANLSAQEKAQLRALSSKQVEENHRARGDVKLTTWLSKEASKVIQDFARNHNISQGDAISELVTDNINE